MRRLLHILFLTFAVSSLHAQSEETNRILSYIQKAMNFNKVVPQEKVYLHFDNMGYFENETLWFKAYVTRTDNGHRASTPLTPWASPTVTLSWTPCSPRATMRCVPTPAT